MSEVPVLVVDDDPRKRFALRAVLAPLGYSIVEADSGIAALRCVMAQDFAVILLDVRMPTMDGFETAIAIRERRESEMTPIIFITAFANDEISTDLYAAGAVDFMFAPVPPVELHAKVSVFARIFIQAAELARQRVELEAMNTELHAVARRDALTGLWNRRALQEDLEILEARAKRYDYSYCLALFDVDRFKAYNDALGHQAGDEALAIVANSLRGEARRRRALPLRRRGVPVHLARADVEHRCARGGTDAGARPEPGRPARRELLARGDHQRGARRARRFAHQVGK